MTANSYNDLYKEHLVQQKEDTVGD